MRVWDDGVGGGGRGGGGKVMPPGAHSLPAMLVLCMTFVISLLRCGETIQGTACVYVGMLWYSGMKETYSCTHAGVWVVDNRCALMCSGKGLPLTLFLKLWLLW